MNKFLLPLALGLLFPTATLAQIDNALAARCKDARDFYGCVRAFTTRPQARADGAAVEGLMRQMAAGLVSGPTFRNAPTNVLPGMNLPVLLRTCEAPCAETTQDATVHGVQTDIDRFKRPRSSLAISKS